jgi:hypothetical protein
MGFCQGADKNILCKVLPDSIKDLLKQLLGQWVKITLKGQCCPICVKVIGVIGDLLVAKKCGKFKFIDIDCICVVKADEEDLLEGIFDVVCDKKGHHNDCVS